VAGAFPELAQYALLTGWPEVVVDFGHVVHVVNKQYAARLKSRYLSSKRL
jgi:hypothetical protein